MSSRSAELLPAKIERLIHQRLETTGCDGFGTLSFADCKHLADDIVSLLPPDIDLARPTWIDRPVPVETRAVLAP